MSTLRVRAELATRKFAVDLDVDDGEVVAVLGPNGAGKSTLLSVIGGLIQPDRGTVALGGRTLTDRAMGIDVPVHGRSIATLSQDALLFPHMTALDNVAFAPRCGGKSTAQARRIAIEWLRAVGSEDLSTRRPEQLSGGQAQRVAIARALAAEPSLLLLDEPLAALDVATAPIVRRVLRTVLREQRRTALIVTHDLLDVIALADTVIVVEDGSVVERGSVADVVTAPRSAFGARIAGRNLLTGTAVDEGRGTILATSWGLRVHGTGHHHAENRIVAVFSPSSVAVHLEPPKASPRNVFAVVIEEMDVHGDAIRVRSHSFPDGSPGIAADVTPTAVADLGLEPGRPAYFVVKTQEVALHPAAGPRS